MSCVKDIRVHDFRHSCASLLIDSGANITLVAKYLGHSKISKISINTLICIKIDWILLYLDSLNYISL
ncbi:MAG: hypothetical protein E7170_04990 [Firmicutes bacterium]|nr:hypothetical protein [Bacillota bacterium]